MATHLLKNIQFIEDSEGYRQQLYFIRDKEGREVDFAITKEKKLEYLIEAKWSEEQISKNLLYFSEKLQPQKASNW